MRTGLIKQSGVCMLSVLFAVLFSMEVLAEANYAIGYKGWDDTVGNGRAVAEWEPVDDSKESRTSYRLRLYRGDLSHPVGSWRTVSGTKCEFTQQIADKGNGTYFYMIKPTKGDLEPEQSELFEVDGAQKKLMKAYLEDLEKQAEDNFQNGISADGSHLPEGWTMNGNYWYYRQADEKLMKASWLQKDGKWYYLSADGQMLTGWQAISGKWYCFDGSGAMYVSTVTPDGRQVNESGAWVENGTAVADSRKAAKKNLAATVSLLTEFDVPVSEKAPADGELYQVTVKNTREAQVTEIAYSVPQEQWVLGHPVTITVTYQTYAGYAFSDSTDYSCSKAAIVSQSGPDAATRTFVLSYIPNIKLKTPGNFFMNSENVLHWDPVPDAMNYEVRVLDDNTVIYKKTGSSTSFRLEDYMDISNLGVRVTALPSPEKKQFIAKSSYAELKDLSSPEGQEDVLIPGKITRNSGTMTYRDENGEPVKNRWIRLGGYWYHFNASGYAESKGWFRDTTGYWYYFDENHRMQTGTVTVDGQTWHLNDGSRTDLPEGARY